MSTHDDIRVGDIITVTDATLSLSRAGFTVTEVSPPDDEGGVRITATAAGLATRYTVVCTEPGAQWVSCSDRLPEIGVTVLLHCPDDGLRVGERIATAGGLDPWMVHNDFEESSRTAEEVSHWMPIGEGGLPLPR